MGQVSSSTSGRRWAYVSIATVLVLLVIVAAYIATTPPTSQRNSTGSVTTTPTSSTTSATTGSPQSDWITYHHDNGRTGYLQSQSRYSPPTTKWVFTVDGAVYAEPLVFRGSAIVVTENDSVYSISLSDSALYWRSNLGTPLPRSELHCGNIDPVGITGTPAIDPSTSVLYVVAMIDGQGYRLFAISLTDGAVRWSTALGPPGFDYHVEQQRGALAIANGLVYAPFGGFAGDCGAYHGRIVAHPTNETGDLISFQVPSTREAGIWAPGGVVVTSNGSIFVATGNSASNGAFDYGNTVMRLTPGLNIQDYFAPSNWVALNAGDTDLGSMPPMELGNGLIFQAGKEGVGYLLNESSLGGIGGQVFSSGFCNGAFGSGALNPSTGPNPIVPCTDGLYSLSVSGPGQSPAFSVKWSRTGFSAGPPIVAYGAAWVVDTSNGTMFAFDLMSGQPLSHSNLGEVTHFVTPAAGEGFIIVAATDRVYSFQIS